MQTERLVFASFVNLGVLTALAGLTSPRAQYGHAQGGLAWSWT